MNYGTSMFLFGVLPLMSVAICPSVQACPARPHVSWRPRFFSSSSFPPDSRRWKSRKHRGAFLRLSHVLPRIIFLSLNHREGAFQILNFTTLGFMIHPLDYRLKSIGTNSLFNFC
jgi:hypothetical protein